MYAKADGSEILNPGLLRHRITWQEQVVTSQDSYGQNVYTWQPVLTCRAQVQARGGMEMERAMQKWADAQFLITQHFSPGLRAKMRILWYVDGETQILDVLGIDDPSGMGRYQNVVCKNFEELNVQTT